VRQRTDALPLTDTLFFDHAPLEDPISGRTIMSRVAFAIPIRWLALLVCTPAWAAPYSVIEIPAPLTQAVALNDNGDVVGNSDINTPGASRAFLYQRSNRVVSQLPCIAGQLCDASVSSINDHATAVGTYWPPGDGSQAVRWRLNGGPEYVNHIVGDFSVATGIANNDDVTGALSTTRGYFDFLWKADGSGVGLGDLVRCAFCVFSPQSAAVAINDRGYVVGWADWAVLTTPDIYGPFVSGVHAFLWRNGAMTDLGALGDGTYSSANALNNADEIVGVTSVGSVNTAFRYARGQMRNLGNLGHQADLNSGANGIDDRGEIVGWSDVRLAADDAVVQRAFLYSFGHLWDLNSLIDRRNASGGRVKLTNAVAINCDGWIAANGYDVRTGEAHAYLLRRHGAERRECRHPRW
jgi:probable HAF family extracellular repeat protein